VVEVLATRVPVKHLSDYMKHNPSVEACSPAVAAGILALLVVVATAIMAKIEERPVLSYGFIDKRRLSRFVLGIAGGVAALSALVLALKMSGWSGTWQLARESAGSNCYRSRLMLTSRELIPNHCPAGPRNFRARNSPHSISDLRSISFKYSCSRLPAAGNAMVNAPRGAR
jgi:hypothetical protein